MQTTSSGDALRPVGQVLEEAEQRRVGPVDVLHDQHERRALRDRLQEPAPGREQLLLRRRLACVDPEQRQQARAQPRQVVATRAATASSFAVATSGGSDSKMPACALTISPSAQNVIPSP